MAVDLFADCEFRPALVHQAVVTYMAGARQGSVAQKTRGQVRGGGRKPWRQKRLGRARAGSIRSPIWRGGGVTFAASPKDHSVRLNRRMYRLAMRSILAEKSRQGTVREAGAVSLDQPRTRLLVDWFKKLEVAQRQRILLVTPEVPDEPLTLAARNLPWVEVLSVRQLNPVALVAADCILFADAALQKTQEWYA